jgi:phosphonatase-like hydrolase
MSPQPDATGKARSVVDPPSLVVFDLAGTTVRDDGQVPAAFTLALAEQGIQATPAQIANVRGASKKEAIGKFIPPGPEHVRRVEEAYQAFQRDLSRRFHDGGVSPMPGAETTFARLRSQGVRIALNTGFDSTITGLLLSTLRWTDLADAVVCGDDVPRGRPAPDLIFRAMELAGIRDPGQVANVGDTTLDLEAGHAAGVRFNVGVLSGAHDRKRMERAPHTHLLADVGEVPGLWPTR